MKKIYLALITIFIVLQFISCKDVPPVVPGLTKSEVALYTSPDSATIYFNNQLAGNVTPFIVSDLEPGFYKFDLKRQNYLDTTINYLLKRNVEDSIYVELREDPKYWWKIYTPHNSTLPNTNLTKIRVDKSDIKWIGTTNNGLIKFDGSSFTVYNNSNSGLPGNTINDIYIDNNAIWVGTDHGFARFDGSGWKVYNSANSQIEDENITALTIDHNNNVWAGTASGLLRFDGVSFKSYNKLNSGLSSDNISALAVDANNALWVGTWGAGIIKYENFIWTVYSSFNSGLSDDYISSIKFDNTGMLYVGTGSPLIGDNGTGGLSYFKDSKWSNINRYNSGFPGSLVTDFAFDNKNAVWVTSESGLAKYFNRGWRIYTTINSGLPDNSLISVSIDRDQNKWCTGTGVSEYIGGK